MSRNSAVTAEHARTPHNNATPAQRRLWRRLRNRQQLGCRFRRQHPLGPTFIAEFVCLERKLIVETCRNHEEYFARIEAELAEEPPQELHDYATLRVMEHDLLNNMDAVLCSIRSFLSCPA